MSFNDQRTNSLINNKPKKSGQRSVRLELPPSLEIPKKLSTSPQQISYNSLSPNSITNIPRQITQLNSNNGLISIIAPTIFHEFPNPSIPSFVLDILTPDISFPFNTNPSPDILSPKFLIFTICSNSITTSPIEIRINNNQISHWISDPRPIDVTSFLAPFSQQNWLIVKTGNFVVPFTILGIWVNYKSLNDIIKEINQKEKFNISDNFVLCPITGRPIITPSKSIYCNHEECFDLIPFITSRQAIGEWFCPICSIPINYNDLRIGQNSNIILNIDNNNEFNLNNFDDTQLMWDF